MEFSELLMKRRSTRAFTERGVTGAEIDKMLSAATNAPSACNMQSWHFYAVTDAAVRENFKSVCAEWAAIAPVIFVVCTDGGAIIERFGERAKTFILQDTALAAENLLLCAADMGLGGCFMGAFSEEKCRALLDIPEKYGIVALIPVGEPVCETPPRNRKPLSEVVTYVGERQDAIAESAAAPFKLRGASLPQALFDDLNLEGATFNNINLHGARFTDINMSATFYGGLTMRDSFFGCVELDGATFENPSFDAASFKRCRFTGASFEDCDMDGATVDGVDIAAAVKYYKENQK